MSDPFSITLREAIPADEPAIWLMLTYAASMTPPGPEAIAEAKRDPYLRTYVDGWGRVGDLGVVATAGAAQIIGAAWLRLGGGGGGPFKLGDAQTPELATAVLPEAQGRGVGTSMLKRLIALASGRYPAIVLSVRETNRAADLYRRFGFKEIQTVANRVGGASLVMRLDLAASAAQTGR